MRRFQLTVLLCAGVLVFVGLACGGDNGEASPTGSVEATATETPVAEPTVASTGAAYDSYHYTVDLLVTIDDPAQDEPAQVSGIVEGDYLAPHSHAFKSTYEVAGISATEEGVIIDSDAWYRDGGVGAWTATIANDPMILSRISLTSADESIVDDPEFVSGIAALNSEPEVVNGVNTRRYHIPKDSIDDLGALLGKDFFANASGITDFDLTAWVGEELNGLVRGEMMATTGPEIFGADSPFDVSPDSVVTIQMTINVTRMNDDSIEIGQPG